MQVKPKQPKPRIAIIGTGRLGTALALALTFNKNYELVALVSRTSQSARRAARLLKNERQAANTQPLDLQVLNVAQLKRLPACDLYIFTTPDDCIAEAAAQLAASFNNSTKHATSASAPIALHLSGALASDELAVLREHRFQLGSMHPLISVSDARQGSADLRTAFYAIEGDARAIKTARKIVRDLGAQAFHLDTIKKSLYHAAAVITSGHTVALFSIAVELLARCGLDERTAQKMLLPLLTSTTQNLTRRPPANALTGSFARFDVATIRRHLAALAASNTNDAEMIYALLGARSIELAKQQIGDVDEKVVSELNRLLKAARKN